MTLTNLAHRLTQYEVNEARSIVRMLLSDCFGWSYTDICCGVLETVLPEEAARLETLMKRLEKGEPIQYVTGYADFCGRRFHVEPGVLIPRPETERLVKLVSDGFKGFQEVSDGSNGFQEVSGLSVLDIGTGSGCIAVTLAKEMPGAEVTAWDISDEALKIARGNAESLDAMVDFKKRDVLQDTVEEDKYDIIVSNPPYICNKEAEEMEHNVLDYEPHVALFVPDDDPLLFYKKITAFSSMALKEDGMLAFEINPVYAKETAKMVSEDFRRFQEVTVLQDQYGKERFLLARKRSLSAWQNG